MTSRILPLEALDVCVCAYTASTDMRGAAAGGLLAAAGDAAPAAAAAQQQLRPGLADIVDIHFGMYVLILVYVSSYCSMCLHYYSY